MNTKGRCSIFSVENDETKRQFAPSSFACAAGVIHATYRSIRKALRDRLGVAIMEDWRAAIGEAAGRHSTVGAALTDAPGRDAPAGKMNSSRGGEV